MEKLKGKKLLILGASPSEVTLVKRAQELGIYTIVTDYYKDRGFSPAKNYADEAWDISWSDLDTLETLCRENKIDGVLAGYSEVRVENLIKLTERLGLPCYTTMEQLELTRNKANFKKYCVDNGIPVVHEYHEPCEVEKFPVIIKPVDRGGSIGISVANNEDELVKAYDYALESSECKDVVIEDFLAEDIKFDVYYVVSDGRIKLLTTSDTFHSPKNGSKRVVQNLWLFPSKWEAEYMKNVDKLVCKMIKNLGIKDGYINFSAFVNDQGEFAFFETGFRLCGTHLYSFLPILGLLDNQDVLLYHSLLGNTKGLELGENVHPELKCIAVNYYAKSGTISDITGVDKVKDIDNCCFGIISARKGEVCNEDKAILAKLGMFVFVDDKVGKLATSLKLANNLFEVESEEGHDMIYDRTPSSVVENWWNK